MFGQQKFAELRFAQVIQEGDGPSVPPLPVWDVKCREDNQWTEQKKEQSTINKCNEDL